jgi:hypothetical protein
MAAVLMVSALAHASTVYVESNAVDTTNSTSHPTVDLAGAVPPAFVWGAAFPGSDWISYGPTGSTRDPGYFSPPNGTQVTFTTEFNLSGAITAASLLVMADDTSSVILNGHLIYADNLTTGFLCAPSAIGCLHMTEGDFTSAALLPYLSDGTNTLSFAVAQTGGGSFGLDFSGEITTQDAQAPEPSTVAILAGGLIYLALLRRRRLW